MEFIVHIFLQKKRGEKINVTFVNCMGNVYVLSPHLYSLQNTYIEKEKDLTEIGNDKEFLDKIQALILQTWCSQL